MARPRAPCEQGAPPNPGPPFPIGGSHRCRTSVVFRMSCIYGSRQLGTEDQGWVAHLARTALEGGPLTVYGDGKQVRDLLYVDDLIGAMLKAVGRIDRSAGQVYNVGGGPANTISVWAELRETLGALLGRISE